MQILPLARPFFASSIDANAMSQARNDAETPAKAATTVAAADEDGLVQLLSSFAALVPFATSCLLIGLALSYCISLLVHWIHASQSDAHATCTAQTDSASSWHDFTRACAHNCTSSVKVSHLPIYAFAVWALVPRIERRVGSLYTLMLTASCLIAAAVTESLILRSMPLPATGTTTSFYVRSSFCTASIASVLFALLFHEALLNRREVRSFPFLTWRHNATPPFLCAALLLVLHLIFMEDQFASLKTILGSCIGITSFAALRILRPIQFTKRIESLPPLRTLLEKVEFAALCPAEAAALGESSRLVSLLQSYVSVSQSGNVPLGVLHLRNQQRKLQLLQRSPNQPLVSSNASRRTAVDSNSESRNHTQTNRRTSSTTYNSLNSCDTESVSEEDRLNQVEDFDSELRVRSSSRSASHNRTPVQSNRANTNTTESNDLNLTHSDAQLSQFAPAVFSSSQIETFIASLLSLGFSRKQAIGALEESLGDVNKALQLLKVQESKAIQS